MSTASIDLRTSPIPRAFLHYLLPALSGMLIKSVFILGDAFFIGIGVGADGLGAIALAMPGFSLFTALAMMVGIGGAALMSMEFGRGRVAQGQALFSQSLLLTAAVVSVVVMAGLVWLEDLLAWQGASGNIAVLAADYLRVLLKFNVVYALTWVLSCFVRNDGNPRLAMLAMSAGAIFNLALDYLFVIRWGWGVSGAALATGLAQLLMAGMLLSHFVRGKGQLRLDVKDIFQQARGLGRSKEIISIGMPTFFIEVTAAMTIVLFNFVLLHHYGNAHLVAYGLTGKVGTFALFSMLGVGQACQPIISFNHGAKQSARVWTTYRLGLLSAMGAGVGFAVLVWVFADSLAGLYLGAQRDQAELAATAMRFYFLAAPLMGLNLVTATLFQATAQPKAASMLSLCRGFVLVVIGVLLLPRWFPVNGIWGSILFAEALTAMLSLALLVRVLRRAELPAQYQSA